MKILKGLSKLTQLMAAAVIFAITLAFIYRSASAPSFVAIFLPLLATATFLHAVFKAVDDLASRKIWITSSILAMSLVIALLGGALLFVLSVPVFLNNQTEVSTFLSLFSLAIISIALFTELLAPSLRAVRDVAVVALTLAIFIPQAVASDRSIKAYEVAIAAIEQCQSTGDCSQVSGSKEIAVASAAWEKVATIKFKKAKVTGVPVDYELEQMRREYAKLSSPGNS